MLIFIRLLPESVTQSDLRRFVDRALHSAWRSLFSTRSRVQSVEIRRLANRRTGSVEYHGVVEVEPAKGAVMAIRKLDRTRLKGKTVEVRKFYQRSPLRDRREARSRVAEAGEEQRKRDRRREHMVMSRVSISGPLQPARTRISQVAPGILRIVE